MKIVSVCCGATLRWRSREKATKVKTGQQIWHPIFQKMIDLFQRKLGKPIRAYVCDSCGKPDR